MLNDWNVFWEKLNVRFRVYATENYSQWGWQVQWTGSVTVREGACRIVKWLQLQWASIGVTSQRFRFCRRTGDQRVGLRCDRKEETATDLWKVAAKRLAGCSRYFIDVWPVELWCYYTAWSNLEERRRKSKQKLEGNEKYVFKGVESRDYDKKLNVGLLTILRTTSGLLGGEEKHEHTIRPHPILRITIRASRTEKWNTSEGKYNRCFPRTTVLWFYIIVEPFLKQDVIMILSILRLSIFVLCTSTWDDSLQLYLIPEAFRSFNTSRTVLLLADSDVVIWVSVSIDLGRYGLNHP